MSFNQNKPIVIKVNLPHHEDDESAKFKCLAIGDVLAVEI